MRNLLILTVYVLLTTMLLAVMLAVFALFAALLPAQEIEEKAQVSLELTEVETLQISIIMKDTLLAAQQIQILQAQFQTATAQRNARQAEFNRMVERLRVVHEAPADKFAFNSAALKFVPIKIEAEPESK